MVFSGYFDFLLCVCVGGIHVHKGAFDAYPTMVCVLAHL